MLKLINTETKKEAVLKEKYIEHLVYLITKR